MQRMPDYRLDPPDWPEPVIVYSCSVCGTGIYDGDDYYEMLDERYCVGCIQQVRHTARAEAR